MNRISTEKIATIIGVAVPIIGGFIWLGSQSATLGGLKDRTNKLEDRVVKTEALSAALTELKDRTTRLEERVVKAEALTEKLLSNEFEDRLNSRVVEFASKKVEKTLSKKNLDPPVGTIIMLASEKIPEGYLLCDGSLVSRDKYNMLFDVIGTKWGEGDGKTTFNVPDLRGEFVRFLDLGRGIDEGRSIGKEHQDWATGKPKNNLIISSSGTHTHSSQEAGNHTHTSQETGTHTHTSQEAGNHTHTSQETGNHSHGDPTWNANTGPYELATTHRGPGGHDYGAQSAPTTSAGNHSHTINNAGSHSHTINKAGSHSHTINKVGSHLHTISGGDGETRPRNQALVAFIKY